MIGPLPENHPHEYPIVSFWYTKHSGSSIERIVDVDVAFFEWAVRTFQDVTPEQADYYYRKTGLKVPKECIQNVEPYRWEPGDTSELYMELCETKDLKGTLWKYREHCQLNLFG